MEEKGSSSFIKNIMKKYSKYSNNEWHLVRVYDDLTLGHEVAATAYKYLSDFGWKGVVSSTRQHPDQVLFSGLDNLVDMKILLETTVALRQG